MAEEQLNQQLFDAIMANNLETTTELINNQGATIEGARRIISGFQGAPEEIYALWGAVEQGESYRDMISYLFMVLSDIGHLQEDNEGILRPYIQYSYSYAHPDIRHEIRNAIIGEGHIATSAEMEAEAEEEMEIEGEDENVWDRQVSFSNILETLGLPSNAEARYNRRYNREYGNRVNDIVCTMGQDMIMLEQFNDRLLRALQESDTIGFVLPSQGRREHVLCYIKEQLQHYWNEKVNTYRGVIANSQQEYDIKKNDPVNNLYFMNFDQLPETFFLLDNAILVSQSQARLFVVVPSAVRFWDTNPPRVGAYHNAYQEGEVVNLIIPVQ